MSEPPRATSPPSNRGPVAPERSFPLIALFHLATLWATMVACIDGARLQYAVRRAPDGAWWTAALIAGALLVGAILGAVIGLGQLRRWRGLLIGASFGALYGLAILGVFTAPASAERGVAAAAVLVVTTVAIRAHAS